MPVAAFAGEIAGAIETLPGVCASLCEGIRQRRVVARSEAEVLVGSQAIDEAAAAWRAIQEAGGAATAFQSLALARAAATQHLARGETPYIAVSREGGRAVAILPAVLGTWGGMRTLRFLGDPLIQYGDALVSPAAEARHIATAWNALKAAAPASFIYFRKVRADAHIAALLDRTASVVASDEAPFVEVSREAPRQARDERELRRFRRRLTELGEVRFALSTGRDALPNVEEAIRLKRQWLQARHLGSQVIGDPGWEAAICDLAGTRSRDFTLSAARLTVGDRAAALEIGLIHGQRWYAFLGTTHPDFMRAGPGHILTAEIIAHCRQQGLSTYDLLAPVQPYKRTMASGAVAVRDYAFALKPQGWLAVWAANRLPAAKKAIAVLPAPIRRRLLRLALRPQG